MMPSRYKWRRLCGWKRKGRSSSPRWCSGISSKINFTVVFNGEPPLPYIPLYHEIDDIKKVKNAAHDYIENYNLNAKKNRINIVLFEDALHSLCKINRIISNPYGHCLNIGLGGSGSHTLTRLATYMQDYKIFEIEMDREFGTNDWLEFLRDVLRALVMDDVGGTFLLSDS